MITKQESEIMLHASKNGRYVSDEDDILKGLVEKGFLNDYGPQAIAGGMHCYVTTPSGRQAINEWKASLPPAPTPKKITRSQQRYQDFLNADRGLSFAEYIGAKK